VTIVAPSLFDDLETFEESSTLLTIRERFEAFDNANPRVYEELERMAATVWALGRRRIGIKTLFETLRWRYWMTTDDSSSHFRLNNNYTPYYARLLIDRHPEWDGLFALRGDDAN
jgi:hypothetical protein